MGKEKFVDNNLVRIRGRLNEDNSKDLNSVGDSPAPLPLSSPAKTPAKTGVSINDREWKKALFKRWDEFTVLKRDVVVKLNELLDTLPFEAKKAEKRIEKLRKSEDKVRKILADIEAVTDSDWDRHSFSQELAAAMRMVENARMECMLIAGLVDGEKNNTSASVAGGDRSGTSVIHELTSLSFGQAFKLGIGFFFPLILGIIAAALLLAVINYISMM